MKRIVSVLIILFITACLFGYSYARKCQKCIDWSKKNKGAFPSIGIAHRDFDRPLVYKDGKVYAWYVCEYGHSYLVCLED